VKADRIRKCIDCGKPWEKRSHRRCSQCQFARQIAQRTAKRQCAHCHKDFMGRNTTINRWCSPTCYMAWKTSRRVRYCPVCNKAIMGRLTYRQVGCSVKCGIILRDQKNPLLTERRYKYKESGEWAVLSRRIRERDGKKCVVCGRVANTHTDHLFPFRLVRSWGLDPNADVNLNSLCTADHARKTHVEGKLFSGDWLGFVQGLTEMHFPEERLNAANEFYQVMTRKT
jgi:hypothetical protein